MSTPHLNEREWLTSALVRPMMDLLCGSPGLIYKGCVQQHPRGRRRLRLFGVAVARRVLHLVSNSVLHQLIEYAEAFADGVGTAEELARLEQQSAVNGVSVVNENASADRCRNLLKWETREQYAAQAVSVLGSRDAASAAAFHALAALALEGENLRAEAARQAAMLRDIFGNPFRPVKFAREWRTSTVKALAAQLYESRDFSAMPILADALQDAGCDNTDVLDHCRDPKATHVRGCWVVDLVLGKS